ncbi:MAG: hypothetical protein IBX68_04060 [Dehalococcoidia bacterium]|nr:hypothetical protein [Dehalococcoidia bacterium]
MSVYKELTDKLEKTEVMQQVLSALEREPVAVFYAICAEYDKSGEAVPDHHLRGAGYWKEVSLRALQASRLIGRETGGRYSVFSYRPTAEGMQYYKGLVQEGWQGAAR